MASAAKNGTQLPELPVTQTSTDDHAASQQVYEIEVYELQTATDAFVGTHGKYIITLHKEYDKAPSNNFASTATLNTFKPTTIVSETHCAILYTIPATKNGSYEIPDSRAGPHC